MTRQEAEELKTTIIATGAFSTVQCKEFGFLSGNWEVHGRIVNDRTGNSTLTILRQPMTASEIKATVRAAKREASAKDKNTRSYWENERRNQW